MPYASDKFNTFYSLKKINDKNPIIFVHGVGLTNQMWYPQVDFFKNYNVLTYDLLGHGNTPLNKTQLKIDDFSNQLLNLIDELNFNKIHLVGFSLGSLIARHFASEHNDRLCSLILHGSIYKRTEEQNRVVQNRYELIKMNKPVAKQSALRRWFTESFINNNAEIYKKIYLILDKNEHKNLLKSYKIFVYYKDDDNMIKKIEVNTLITTGENDVGSTPEMAKNLSSQIKNSKFIKIKKGKHLCNIECDKDFNTILEKFIDENYEC